MFKDQRVIMVMPAYNAAKTLRRTYDEVMEQDYVDQVILVDDGRGDETVSIARSLPKTKVHPPHESGLWCQPEDVLQAGPGRRWQHHERKSLIERSPVDAVLVLALVHHLAISNNLPLENIADFFARIGHSLIIEFVPKTDPQVQRLLALREDIFPDYTKQAFEECFKKYFTVKGVAEIKDCQRTLYLMVMDNSKL